MPRYSVTFEEAHEALTEHNGRMRDAAKMLDIKIHTLKSLVDSHAELKAIVHERDLEIADISRDVVRDYLEDDGVAPERKVKTAQWALENLASDAYSKSSTIDVNANKPKDISDMTEEELQEQLKQVQGQIQEYLPPYEQSSIPSE